MSDDKFPKDDGVYQFDPQLGYMPAIPLPYYLNENDDDDESCRCDCGSEFKTQAEYRTHYALTHI